jgi:hypothetical protein
MLEIFFNSESDEQLLIAWSVRSHKAHGGIALSAVVCVDGNE